MSSETAHHEKNFQNYIVAQLKAMGWLVGTTDGYDPESALFTEDVLDWVQATQPKSWEKLEATHKGKALDALTDRLAKALEKDGTVQVLRGGFQVAGAGHFDMSEAAPEDLRNQGVLDRYKANRLRVVPELKYHPAHEYAIDLVFFINGIPVGTTEIKTDFTQAVEDAMEQYRNDRKPYDPVTKRKEPLLTFKRGAVVHFAMSDSDNLPESFHKYPMRQAIEEGFILDVLQNYVPYKTAYNLSEQLGKDKRVNTRQARRALAQWMALHPTNVTQKVQLIVEHFSKNVAHLLEGKAKAMVVTSSRAAAVRYKKGFDAYIMKHPEHAGIRALVAFSGKLTAKQVNHPADEHLKGDDFKVAEDEEFTEVSMNPETMGADLRAAFDRPEYRVMLVADKFQTGFDQPKLVAMYIDKKIANEVEIVQTLWRPCGRRRT